METMKIFNRKTKSFNNTCGWLASIYAQASRNEFLPIKDVMYKYNSDGKKISLQLIHGIDGVYSYGFLEKHEIIEISEDKKNLIWISNETIENLTEKLKLINAENKVKSAEKLALKKKTKKIFENNKITEENVETKKEYLINKIINIKDNVEKTTTTTKIDEKRIANGIKIMNQLDSIEKNIENILTQNSLILSQQQHIFNLLTNQPSTKETILEDMMVKK